MRSFSWLAVGVAVGGLACGAGADTAVVEVPPFEKEIAEQPLAIPAGGKGTTPKPCADGREPAHLWQGEYPGPVVDVTTPVTVEVQTDLCGAEPKKNCTVAAGIYHPWANATAEYWTVRSVEKYVLEKPAVIGETNYPAGTVLEVTAYVGEGYCGMRTGGKDIDGSCPDMLGDDAGNPVARREGPEPLPETQLVSVACAEGGTGYWPISEEVTFQIPGVKPGTILEYGRAGKAE